MAEGAWVPAFDSLWRHQKTKALAAHKEIPSQRRHAMAGLWLELCAWARDARESGDLAGLSPGTIAEAVGLPASKGPELLEALTGADLLSRDGRLHISGWEDGPGRLIEKRKAEREKKRRQRGGEQRAATSERDEQGRFGPSSPGTAGSGPAGHKRPVPGDRPPMSPGREQREQRVQTENPPTPRPVGRTDEAAVEAVGARAAEDLLRATPEGRWRDALQALLIAGMTSANLCTWFVGTTLEERGGFAIVRGPNAFTVEWLTKKYRPQIAHVLGLPTTRVVIALEGQAVELEPEPVEDVS